MKNIYDNPQFFAAYKDLRDNNKGFNEAIEVPAMQRLIKNVKGLKVLDLGCGLGHQANYLIEQGAKQIVALDVSQKMIDECNRRIRNRAVSFTCEAIESFDMGTERYNIVLSSMVFHYIQDLEQVFSNVFKALTADGQFIFSMEHPICTACQTGWIDLHEQQYWVVKEYSNEGVRYQNWFVEGVQKYHRKLSSIVELLLTQGFTIATIDEPQPSAKWLDSRPDLAQHIHRPPVLIVKACKRLE